MNPDADRDASLQRAENGDFHRDPDELSTHVQRIQSVGIIYIHQEKREL